MWTPSNETDLRAALANRILGESAYLDVKAAPPPAGRNKDIARDVCAMTVEGGVLIYGVGGDDPTRPDTLTPFPLAGVTERIDQVAQSAISEPPPGIEFRDFTAGDGDDLGYIVVVVPPSPRAPHMVTLEGESRYYGRGATGNRILTEGEVARLYERRERFEVDRDAWLNAAIAASPFTFEKPLDQIGPMVVETHPILGSSDLLRRAAGSLPVPDYLRRTCQNVARAHDPYPGQGTSGLADVFSLERRGVGTFALSSGSEPTSRFQARVEFRLDGTMTYWHSPTLNTRSAESEMSRRILMEQSVTRGLHQTLSVAGAVYQDAGFRGSVDAGVAVLGLEFAKGASAPDPFGDRATFGAEDYRHHERLTMRELAAEPESVCRRFLGPLYEVISQPGYDLYAARDGGQ